MEKIEYFRENGVEEHALYELEGKILQFMPEFVAENFDEFFAFLKEDISAIYLTVHNLLEDGSYDETKKIADPLAAYLERHKVELLDGHHCHLNAFETALYKLEEKRVIPTPKAKYNYAAFLIDYFIILQRTLLGQRDSRIYRSGLEESRKYLEWVLKLCPQNSAGWLYLGVSYDYQEEKQLECYTMALRYCYQLEGTAGIAREDGLTQIYEHLAKCYRRKNQMEVVVALKELITTLKKDSYVLYSSEFWELPPAARPYRDVLQKHNIQIGFSDIVRQTAEFLADPRSDMQNNWDVETWIREIRAVKI